MQEATSRQPVDPYRTPPAFPFLVAILMVTVLQFHFSPVISTLREQNMNLTQAPGILETQVKDPRRALGPGEKRA